MRAIPVTGAAMKDWLFFPLIILAAGVMVYIALNWGDGPHEGNPDDGWVIEGAELDGLVPSPGTFLTMKGTDSAILTADFRVDQTRSQGVFTTLAGNYAKSYGGKKLQLTIRAKAADENPAQTFQIAFLPVPSVKGRFGWRDFTPTDKFQDFVITTKLAAFDVDDPVIYFGVWPDKDGKGGGIEVERYAVRPID